MRSELTDGKKRKADSEDDLNIRKISIENCCFE